EVLFFFFSSRRRHTRFSRDWSSDVCSSDLAKLFCHLPDVLHDVQKGLSPFHHENIAQNVTQKADISAKRMIFLRIHRHGSLTHEIGRASCRERGSTGVVA